MSGPPERKGTARRAVSKLVLFVALYVLAGVVVTFLLTDGLPALGIEIASYSTYVYVLLALGFGYLIVSGFADVIYWSAVKKYAHSTASSLRNLFRIVGVGAMAAAIAGGVAGGASGVALGGFLGLVVGFASQQVLGQALAGLLLLVARPFKVDDVVNLSGEDGVVSDVSTLFTTLTKSDGTKVLIPNNSILGAKIYLKKQQ